MGYERGSQGIFCCFGAKSTFEHKNTFLHVPDTNIHFSNVVFASAIHGRMQQEVAATRDGGKSRGGAEHGSEVGGLSLESSF